MYLLKLYSDTWSACFYHYKLAKLCNYFSVYYNYSWQILCTSPCRITLNWSMIMVPEVITDVKNRSWGTSTISYNATISREAVTGPSRKGDWLLQTGAEGLLKKEADGIYGFIKICPYVSIPICRILLIPKQCSVFYIRESSRLGTQFAYLK